MCTYKRGTLLYMYFSYLEKYARFLYTKLHADLNQAVYNLFIKKKSIRKIKYCE